MERITFEQLPEVVGEIKDQLMRIENILMHLTDLREPEALLLTLKEASAFVNLAESTIYSKVCRMEIPVIKKGKKLYFQKEELLKWLLEGKRSKQTQVNDAASDFFNKAARSRNARRVKLKR
jgi:excisionase family DNA binding protein